MAEDFQKNYGDEPRMPAIPDVRTATPEAVMGAMKEWVEVRQGKRGDPIDRGVTVRDLLNADLVTPGRIAGLIGGPEPIPLIPSTPSGDMPPTPGNLKADGALRSIMLTWDFAVGYNRLAFFEIWRSATDALGAAVKIGQTFAPLYTDEVGPGASFYYWVRAVSDSGNSSPYNAVAGTLGETAIDVDYVLDLLEGQITESELFSTLGARINLIDGPISLPGSVNSRVNTVQIIAANAAAAISTETTLRVNADNSLFAQYSVKVDNNGYVSGFGLMSTPINGVPTSSFIIRADSFAIAAPAGSGIATAVPFIVRTTPTTINGVPVGIGTYIDSVYISNGVITNAKIGNLAVDDAKIASLSVGKLTAGSLQVGAFLSSTNYSTGLSGFILQANGNAEFSNATVRGGIYATSGEIGGTEITVNGMQSPNYSAGLAGWRIFNNGYAEFNTVNIRGILNAAGGTFVGNVVAGQFLTGSFVDANWPAAGLTGSYMGPAGIKLGNFNDGKYIQIDPDGSIYTPGFNVINGVMTIQQANVINTLNVAGEAIQVIRVASGAGGVLPASGTASVVSQNIAMVAGSSGVLATMSINMSGNGANANVDVTLLRNGSVVRTQGVSVQNGYVGTFTIPAFDNPGNGTHTYSLQISNPASGPGGNQAVTYQAPFISLAGAKR